MPRLKGTRPEQYAGIFQSYSAVPQRYRLETYAAQYEDRDTWQQYVDAGQYAQKGSPSDYLETVVRRAGDAWLDHMQARDRHHALATPADANAWAEYLLAQELLLQTCYEHYYGPIYRFYDHLKASYQHPHVYNTLLVAAIEHDAARQIWEYRIKSRPEVNTRE